MVTKVLCMGDDGKVDFKHMSDIDKSRIDEIIPVFSSCLKNWKYSRDISDERFIKYGDSNLECALLCMNVILSIIEEEGTEKDKEELNNFLNSFSNQQ